MMVSPQILFYFLVCSVSIILPLLLDAYGFKEESIELSKYSVGFLVGFAFEDVIL